MYGDSHNLKPSASTVNQSKSNLDFDNGGEQHSVATGCYYTDSTWEARDEVKGDIARIIFYMSTRYEGENGELDLEVVDRVNTFPLPEHGKLSTLLEWNLQDPPDEFERNRNDVLFSFQRNRNPFIDDPNFAELIWGDATPSEIAIDNFQISPDTIVATKPVEIKSTITNSATRSVSAKLFWGLSFEALSNEVVMTGEGDIFKAEIPAQAEGATVYYKLVASDGDIENTSVVYKYYVRKTFTGTLTTIYDIQGQLDGSPYEGEVVSTTGIVTGNFGDHYYIQDGYGEWNGLYIYELGRNPLIGDSVVITGEISEWYGKTEMKNIKDYYFISSDHELPEPLLVQTGQISEGYESVLVRVNNAICTDDNYPANYYMWTVDDGSGELRIRNTAVFEYEPSQGSYYNISGPLDYDFDEWKISLRNSDDITGGGDTDGPVVNEATPVNSTNIKLIFNEPVEATTAENATNYTLNNDAVIESASQHAFNKTQVNLTVSTLSGEYELTVQNIEDGFGNVMEPQTVSLSYVGLAELLLDGDIKVFPNPATDRINISFNATEAVDLEISLTDISGKQLKYEQIKAGPGMNAFQYQLDNLNQGMYLLYLSNTSGSATYKVFVR